MGDVMSADRSRQTVHKHVQVREYVRGLISGRRAGQSGAFRARARPAVRGRPDDRPPGPRRPGVRGPARADPRPRHVRGPRQDRRPGAAVELQRGDGPPRHDARVAHAARRAWSPPGPASPGRWRSSEGDKVVHWQRLRLADDAPMCIEDAFLADSIVPGFLDEPAARQPLRRAQRRDLMPTWGEDSVDAAARPARGGRAARPHARAPRCCASRGARSPTTSPVEVIALHLPRRPLHPLGAAVAAEHPGRPRGDDRHRPAPRRRGGPPHGHAQGAARATATTSRTSTGPSGGCSTAAARTVTVVLGAAADEARGLLDEAGWADDDAVRVVVADD